MPKGFGGNEPVSAGASRFQSPPHPLQLACTMPGSFPHQYRVEIFARAAYSHSASVGSRYGRWVVFLNHSVYRTASDQLTSRMGDRSVADTKSGALQPWPLVQAIHSP